MLSFTFLYASFYRRVAALIIDLAILAVVCFFLLLPFLSFLGIRELSTMNGATHRAAFSVSIIRTYGVWTLLSFILSWLYFALQESSARQGTIGKRIMGVLVFTMGEQRISFRKASLRFGAKLLSAAILGIGLLMPLFNAERRALHDLICHTQVLEPRRELIERPVTSISEVTLRSEKPRPGQVRADPGVTAAPLGG